MSHRGGIAGPPARQGGTIDQAVILLIEDDPHIARFASATLRLEGHTPYIAVTGEDGIAAALRYRPGVILLDLMLPGLDGIEVLRRLKADPRTATIPVVVFSAATWGDEERRTRELGADGYLAKPASAADLAEAVRRALERE